MTRHLHSLSFQLLKSVLSIYFGITLMVTLSHMGIEYQYTRNSVANELASVESTFSPALTTALWELNYEQLEALHRGIVELPVISSMQITDASGRQLIDATKAGVVSGLIIHQFSLYHHFSGEDVFLAEVQFQASGDVVFDRLRMGFQMILVSALIKSTALTLLFLWAFRRRLGRPIQKLTTAVGTIDLDTLAEKQRLDLKQPEVNELTTLEVAFNRMLDRLEEERVAHYAALEFINRGLEQQVAIRTQDLLLANQKLEQLVRTDPLTGIANRRHFVEQVTIEIQRARRENTALSLLMMDLDHFKRINDHWGHETGDHVLCHFTKLVRTPLRASDLLARLGGEEFALLLPNTSLEAATEVAARILDAVRSQCIPSDAGEIRYSTSIGAASLLPQETSYEPLLRRADACLYRAKEQGRNGVVSDTACSVSALASEH